MCVCTVREASLCSAVLLLHFSLTGLIRKWWQPMIVKMPISEWQISSSSALLSTFLPPGSVMSLFPAAGLAWRGEKVRRVEVARGTQSPHAVLGLLCMSRNNTPTMWRSEPESDSLGVKLGVAALSLASVLTNKALRIVALDRYDRSNMESLT